MPSVKGDRSKCIVWEVAKKLFCSGGRQSGGPQESRGSSGTAVLPTLRFQTQPGEHPLRGLRLPQGVLKDEVRRTMKPQPLTGSEASVIDF